MKYLNFKIGKSDTGVAAIEFVVLAPLLILTVFGLVEIANYVFCTNKMNRTAQGVSNIITRGDLTKPQLDALLVSAALISEPFNFANQGCVFVSSITQNNANTQTTPKLNWTDSYPAGCGVSQISLGSLPGGLVLSQNETIITTEVSFVYQPIFVGYQYNASSLLTAAQLNIYALAVAVPRKGLLTSLPPS